MAGADAKAVLRNILSDEALRVRNFLEDYWQFNEIDPTSFRSAESPRPGESDPFRVYYPPAADGTPRYDCGYQPGFHSYGSCGRACEKLYAAHACVTYCGHAIGGPTPVSSSPATQHEFSGIRDIVNFWACCPLVRRITSFNYHRIQGAVSDYTSSEMITVQMEAVLTEPLVRHSSRAPKTKSEPDIALSCSLVLIPVNDRGEGDARIAFRDEDIEVPVVGTRGRRETKTRKIFRARVLTEVVRVIE